MNNFKRSFYRINNFNTNYKHFLNFYEKFDENKTNEKFIKLFFDNIKLLFEYYHKTLNDLLKEEGIVEYLPSKILRLAEEKNIIDNSKIWLEYINDLNILIQSKDKDFNKNKKYNMVEKYKEEHLHNYEILNKYYDETAYKSFVTDSETLSEIPPKYLPDEVGLSPNRYGYLMRFFRENESIERVWLFGSRLKPKFRTHTDIDLIIEAPSSEYDSIKRAAKVVKIPNRLDITIKSSNNNDDFLNAVTKTHPKLIYEKQH